MRHGSLFSGIGGFDLAAQWIGWENTFHCEIDPYCRKILNYWFPKSISYEDIKKTDFTQHRGSVDIISGGFPCQPYSVAGKRKGSEDDRHLWPEMLRAIGEIQPSWIVGENVGGIINWSDGLVFEQIQIDLETQGYQTTSFILPACGKNAPHKRDRIWIVAYANGKFPRKPELGKDRQQTGEGEKEQDQRERFWDFTSGTFGKEDATNATGFGLQGMRPTGWEGTAAPLHERLSGRSVIGNPHKSWGDFPTQSPVYGGNDGLSNELDGTTLHGYSRAKSLKGVGNAIVPQIAFSIFEAIHKIEDQK